METFELLKKLRLDRGYSQEKLAHNITSRSCLAKYENGNCNIPFPILLDLLDKMNVTIDEFSFYLEIDKARMKNHCLRNFVEASKKGDASVKETIEKFANRADKNKDILSIRNYLIVKTYNWAEKPAEKRRLNGKDNRHFHRLIRYLERVDNWGKFELLTFGRL